MPRHVARHGHAAPRHGHVTRHGHHAQHAAAPPASALPLRALTAAHSPPVPPPLLPVAQAPLLHGPFGAACTRCAESDLHTAQCLGHTLQALAAEPTLVPRLTADGGGGALALACGLAAACHDTHTQYALVETIGACADEPTFGWRLVGFGALQPLLRAAAVPPAPAEPPIAEVARRALRALKYDELWRGAACDPLDEAVVREALTAARAAKGSPGKPGTGRA
jgi:hypothetical protein